MQETSLLFIKEVLNDINGITFRLYFCEVFRNGREVPVIDWRQVILINQKPKMLA